MDHLGPFYRLGIGAGQDPEAPALHNLYMNIHNMRDDGPGPQTSATRCGIGFQAIRPH